MAQPGVSNSGLNASDKDVVSRIDLGTLTLTITNLQPVARTAEADEGITLSAGSPLADPGLDMLNTSFIGNPGTVVATHPGERRMGGAARIVYPAVHVPPRARAVTLEAVQPASRSIPTEQEIDRVLEEVQKHRSSFGDYVTVVKEMLSIEPMLWVQRFALTALGATSVSVSTFAFSETVALIGESAGFGARQLSDETGGRVFGYFAASVSLWCLYYFAQYLGDLLTARQQHVVDLRVSGDVDQLVGQLPEQVRERQPAAELIGAVKNTQKSAQELVSGVISLGQQVGEMLVTTAGMVISGVSFGVVPIFISGYLRYRSALRISAREVDAENQAAPVDLLVEDGEGMLAHKASVSILQVCGCYERVARYVAKWRAESGAVRLKAVERNELDQLVTDFLLETPVVGASLYFILRWWNGEISSSWCIWLLMSAWSLRDNISEIGSLLSAQVTDLALSSKRLALHQLADRWGDNRATVELSEAPSIEFQDVRLRRPGLSRDTLKGIKLQISAGETVAVLGENGVGKSSLIGLLLGRILPTSGDVAVGGFNTRKYKIRPGVLDQSFTLMPGLTVRENIALLSADESAMTSDEAVQFLGVVDILFDDKPRGLDTVVPGHNQKGPKFSGGQEQLIALARALAGRSPLIVLDEPSSDLSPERQRLIFDKVLSLPWKPTVVIVTHSPEQASRCDRVVIMERGTIVEHGDPAVMRTKRGSRLKRMLDLKNGD